MKKLFFSLALILGIFSGIPGVSHATVQNTINNVTYSGDGTSTSFSFNNNVYLSTDLIVYTDVVSTGVITTLTLNISYSVTLTPISGTIGAYTATISLAGGSSPFGALPIGTNLIISRSIPYTQLINISDYSSTPAATWNQALDRSAILAQQLYALSNQSVLQPVGSTTPVTLPSPVLGQYLTWGPNNSLINSNGTGAQGPAGQGVPTGGTINQVLTKNSSTNYDSSWKTPATAGTVTSVTSANSDITVATTTSTPVLTLNSGTGNNQIVKLNGSAQLPAVSGALLTNLPSTSFFVPNNIQVFTSSGTWTKPGGVSNVYVKVVGRGGNGGTCISAGFGSGGGSGGYAEGVIAVTGNVTVTIGSTNSFAGTTTISATTGTAGTTSNSSVPGSGGTASGGSLNTNGSPGFFAGSGSTCGMGASSLLSTISSNACGSAGNPYGGGGAGSTVAGSCQPGGTGDPGAVIVYY